MDSATRQVVIVSVATSLATLCVVAAVAMLFRPHLHARMQIDPQQLEVSLPQGVPMTVDIVKPIETQFRGELDVRFPIDEVLPLHFDSPLTMNISIDAQVPMRTVIEYENTLPLDTEVTAHIFGFPVQVPVSGRIPVKLYVPVDQLVPVKFSAPVTVSMDEALPVPIKLDFNTRIPLDQSLSIPITAPLETNVQVSDRPVTVKLGTSELVFPLDAMNLEFGGNNDEE